MNNTIKQNKLSYNKTNRLKNRNLFRIIVRLFECKSVHLRL